MNPAAMALVDQMMGDDELVFDARRVARAVIGVSLIIAIPLGGGVLYNQHQISQIESLSGSMETVIEGRSLLQAAHASGVASGLTIGGVHVPADLIDRIETIVEDQLISGTRVLSEARMNGLEAALTGNWTSERLEEYVSRIETADPDLGRIISEEAGRLSEAGVPEDDSRSLMRAMAVKLMTGEAREELRHSGRVVTGSEAERLGILDQAQSRIWTRLEETNRVGGLDPALTRDLAIMLVAGTLEQGPANDEPGL